MTARIPCILIINFEVAEVCYATFLMLSAHVHEMMRTRNYHRDTLASLTMRYLEEPGGCVNQAPAQFMHSSSSYDCHTGCNTLAIPTAPCWK